jgi:hypothetical protein
MMNLLPYLQQSSLRPLLVSWESCIFTGEPSPGVLKFKLSKGDQKQDLLLALVIRREEALVWKSCDELLERTLKTAAQTFQGFFGFQLLTLELGERLRSFQWENLRQYLVNQARNMAVGEVRMVQYTSLFGLFKKRIAETYGKIDYQSAVKVYLKEPEQFDLTVKNILKQSSGPAVGVIQDLSREPIFRFGDEAQTPRLRKTLEKIKEAGALPEFYILDSRGVCELGAQFGMRSHV